jgi:frataxin-like iron-binding protein CyaY
MWILSFYPDVWSGHRSSDKVQDRLATARLIEILKNFQDNGELFTNKKMRRKEIWVEIASQLISEGFHFRNKDQAWEKVSQKWRNMERAYRVHVHNVRRKGLSSGSVTMEFFGDLHELLSRKYHTESILSLDNSSSFDLSNPSQNEGDETRESMEMTNGELLEYYPDEEEQHEEEESAVSGEAGPILMEAELCYDTYVEDDIPPSPTFSDNKNLVFSSSDQEIDISCNPHTAGVRDPVLRLLLEMRAQERAHFREDRRERLKMQRDTLDFRRDLIHLLNQHHQERMEAMHSLIAAIGGSLGATAKVTTPLPNGDHSGAHEDEKNLPFKS